MQNKQLIQQKIITEQPSVVSSRDRGINYGDGFFTTAKIVDGNVEHWSLHRARLSECASRLAFPEIEFIELEAVISQLIATQKCAVLKVLVTRGEGGRGYGLPEQPLLNIVLSVVDFPSHYEALGSKGLSLAVSPIKLASQPLFAGLKTLNRLEQVMIKQAMQRQDSDDVLVLDYQNNVIETSAANVFAIKGGRVFTPLLNECGIKGVYLQSLCAKLPIEFMNLTLEQLKQMDAVFVCNSLMGVLPVKEIDTVCFDINKSSNVLSGLMAKEFACLR
ncbi:aminodeoxychorismate lyase [Pseudoalteromonas sp. H105]|uniref:aminodeoxychorismate lyase n=1 Tax=Pseudoalteromonas sp. H105 TaxID=1348393 RepID=UPI0007320B59|nr:aminodeoxychorismate lyase [Pseudoalteromonas sp. H105]KTF18426.1 aminodeoxychorismate lyase [Pseudoalteromonas sp. H105]